MELMEAIICEKMKKKSLHLHVERREGKNYGRIGMPINRKNVVAANKKKITGCN